MTENYRLILFLLSLKAGKELANVDRATLANALGEAILQFGKIAPTGARNGIINGVIEIAADVNLVKLQTLINKSGTE